MIDSLEKLLRQTDAAYPPPPVDPDWADAVRSKAHRRRAGLRIAATAVAAIIFLVVVVPGSQESRNGTTDGREVAASATPVAAPSSIDVEKTRTELAALRAKADLQADVAIRVAQILREEAVDPNTDAAPSTEYAFGDPQADRAARRLLDEAERQRFELDRRPTAARLYKETITLFPTSPWAEVAQERLAEMQSEKGNVS